jgi:excisionase family DNA binding protein
MGEQTETSELSERARPLLGKDLQLFTVVEVSQFLGIGRSKVYELLYKGELKSVKIGGSRRIRYSDLGEYVRYLDDAS